MPNTLNGPTEINTNSIYDIELFLVGAGEGNHIFTNSPDSSSTRGLA